MRRWWKLPWRGAESPWERWWSWGVGERWERCWRSWWLLCCVILSRRQLSRGLQDEISDYVRMLKSRICYNHDDRNGKKDLQTWRMGNGSCCSSKRSSGLASPPSWVCKSQILPAIIYKRWYTLKIQLILSYKMWYILNIQLMRHWLFWYIKVIIDSMFSFWFSGYLRPKPGWWAGRSEAGRRGWSKWLCKKNWRFSFWVCQRWGPKYGDGD